MHPIFLHLYLFYSRVIRRFSADEKGYFQLCKMSYYGLYSRGACSKPILHVVNLHVCQGLGSGIKDGPVHCTMGRRVDTIPYGIFSFSHSTIIAAS
jgi:hypothetical protein